MDFEISRREVLNNLIRFKDSLLENSPEGKIGKERVYRVLLNRKTGDMRFPQSLQSLEGHIAKKRGGGESVGDWKEVRIIVSETEGVKTHFDLLDIKNQQLKEGDLDPLAWRIMRETLEILEVKAKETNSSGELPEKSVLQDLSSIHLSSSMGQIESLPGWMGVLSRLEAEKKLQGKPVGTYLLRKGDPISQWIVLDLARENGIDAQGFLITVVEEDEKISDLLLIQTFKGWIYYQDNPNLRDSSFYKYSSTPQELLRGKLGEIARRPLSD